MIIDPKKVPGGEIVGADKTNEHGGSGILPLSGDWKFLERRGRPGSAGVPPAPVAAGHQRGLRLAPGQAGRLRSQGAASKHTPRTE